MDKTEALIQKFISKIKSKYGAVIDIQYEYNLVNKEYDIWHNNAYLQFESKEFQEFIGEQIESNFFDNGVFNFSFGYDYFKTVQKYQYNIYSDNFRINKINFLSNTEGENLKSEVYIFAKAVKYNQTTDFVKNENLEKYKDFNKIILDKSNQILTDKSNQVFTNEFNEAA